MPEILQKVYMAGICASWTRASERIFRANQQKVISAGVMVGIWQKQRKQTRKRYSVKTEYQTNCSYPRSKTMKKLLPLILLFTIIGTLYAEAPELKNMMPNSWQKLTRLEAEEEKEFLKQESILTEIIALQKSEFEGYKLEEINIQVFTETNLKLDFF